ncbi:serine/threonine protein kinase [Trypanosoma grayi]|uniref:serine/threonine protein kinase n=1 Tax=Trypanosoma grayi TaxID=71804 RepID=UPI0004F43B9F|nr:serine/threonine protein kinase [Trypanosoma grayi]KEG14364.1 serine/threonine protein kinase [Trypanosoma grayi]
MKSTESLIEAVRPPFSTLEHINTPLARDDDGGSSTPLSALQQLGSRMPPTVPETPAKQRRTVHGAFNESHFTQISTNHRPPRSSLKDIRKALPSRKRPSAELSQFSALQLDDTANSTVLALQDGGSADAPRRCSTLSTAPPPLFSATVLFPSQPSSPQGEWMPRRGLSASLMRALPEVLDDSQADTECSNFFSRRILTDYREVKELGCGSFGKVTLYEETSTGALVAVKVSPPLASAEQRQRFVQERAVLTLVRGFPHVVQLLDAWEEGRTPQIYLQLEYCKGGSVADAAETRRRRGERWDERELLVFLAHVALALDALHSANIAHMDFKPDNVLIDNSGGYKLTDFGCSVTLNEEGRPRRPLVTSAQRMCSMTDTGLLSAPTQLSIVSVEEGDCRYLCSDMLNQKRYLKAGDMFSFGISLFELMSGEALPHHGAPFLELRCNPPVALLERRGYSSRLIDLTVALMHNDPTARPTARDVLRFVQLPPQAPLVVTKWAALECGSTENGIENGSSNEKPELLDVRFMHAALEVASRLVDIVRRSLGTGLASNGNGHSNDNIRSTTNGGGGGGGEAARRLRVDVDVSCTPKTPRMTR